MDTLFYNTKNNINLAKSEFTLALVLFFILLLNATITQTPMYATDILAQKSIGTPILQNLTPNYDTFSNEKEEFESRIYNKYRNANIYNITDGIKHIKLIKYVQNKPVRINIVEINSRVAKDFEIKPAIASNTLNNKRSIRNIALKTNSIVAINGGFFKPQNGIPLGTLMIDRKMYTGPIYNRVALGIFEDGYDTANIALNAKIIGNNKSIKIDNINQPRMLSSYILAYTRDWGSIAPVSPQYGVQLQIIGNKIVKASANPLSIPENGYVLVGPKSKLSQLFGAEYVETNVNLDPSWDNVKHIISGGPYLIKKGNIYIDVTREKLQAINGRNPRTAVGYTKDNDLILLTADGREGSSVGLTLYELAAYMQSLGCIEAINLDGGGSTVMYVNGKIVNHPQQEGGIALSNALVISKKTNN